MPKFASVIIGIGEDSNQLSIAAGLSRAPFQPVNLRRMSECWPVSVRNRYGRLAFQGGPRRRRTPGR
jgi:hypothetical protein